MGNGSGIPLAQCQHQEIIFPATLVDLVGEVSEKWHPSKLALSLPNIQIRNESMTRIGLLSDTHNYMDDNIIAYLKECSEIWHAGDFGTLSIARKLEDATGLPLRGVYGNIDGKDVREIYPEKLFFTCENVPVFMQHIGGYPGRYAPGVKQEIMRHGAKIFISGHSHILKIMYDPALDCLHMNPGAAGKQGWHKTRTLIRFNIHSSDIRDCEVIELVP